MSGPLLLREEVIVSLEVRPGVYVLGWPGDGAAQGLYVGRAESDLRAQLMHHLPGRETSIRLQIFAPDRFWFHYTETPEEAFRIECQLYHAHHYVGNITHPDRGLEANWECPVCAQRLLQVAREDREEGRRAVA